MRGEEELRRALWFIQVQSSWLGGNLYLSHTRSFSQIMALLDELIVFDRYTRHSFRLETIARSSEVPRCLIACPWRPKHPCGWSAFTPSIDSSKKKSPTDAWANLFPFDCRKWFISSVDKEKFDDIKEQSSICLSLPLPSIVKGSMHCFSLQPLSVLIQSDFEPNESIHVWLRQQERERIFSLLCFDQIQSMVNST